MTPQAPVITVDGPSGSGKGTICQLIAAATGFHLLDSGAIYRLAALAALNAQVDIENEQQVCAIAQALDIKFELSEQAVVTRLAGQDVSRAIRQEKVGMTASKIAAYPSVRAALLACQQAFQQAPGLVADGRDMGTVVFPSAALKIFLTASAEERARRRVNQLKEAGQSHIDEARILADIVARDERDTKRATAPLKPAQDALVLDSTTLSIEEVANTILNEIKKRRLTTEA